MLLDRNELITTHETLSNLIGCPGHEEEVANFILSNIEDHVDEAWRDPLGNVLAKKEGTRSTGKKILLDAHIDEVGFMVNHIDENGFLRVDALGGIDKRVMLGQMVQFQSDTGETVVGIVGSQPPHTTKKEEREKVPEIRDMFIDVGCDSDEEVREKGLHVGTVGTFYTKFKQLDGDTLIGKAFDDRTACNVLIHVLKLLSKANTEHTILANFAAQEEVGGRGAKVGAFELKSDIALALENTIASDVPDVSPSKVVTTLGNGPAITAADKSLITPPRILTRLKKAAERDNIQWQYKKPTYGGTDAGRIALTRSGVPSGVVSVPCRYIHGPVGLLKVDDLVDTIRLVKNFCTIP
ncbi:MAG: M42 family metallopeptidase [Candidatus Korarchaeota archaeon]|nr:M42 family metallopeptidase [Candidatus Korarchaeota archaeon]NIU81938.1 M42 family peptidase [Candidatus Thorarchaeota archaeon]NIW12396.1 M42 family peptidase [Candidatus Thorarchaeota archaeon]NIW51188.1 M42 family peptidase [Candidatus Korarchaeota archaeon]